MPLLRPAAERAPLARTHTTISCPYNGHQTGWCRGLCRPAAGLGFCGRPAPHALVSRHQAAIAASRSKVEG